MGWVSWCGRSVNTAKEVAATICIGYAEIATGGSGPNPADVGGSRVERITGGVGWATLGSVRTDRDASGEDGCRALHGAGLREAKGHAGA